ncbi:MAG: F-type H+-transporting ATPase subunit a [Blastocatellia bacterium]|jgi:F-type H+-transporting ATPase subunit a|nr:F-type H+-transporting ATPase subunit a [Blastocatellia bacterium]
MFLLQSTEAGAKAAEHAPEHAEHVPILVKLVNQYFGEWAYNFEMHYTYPKWKWLLAKFGSTPEAAFGAYTPENAIPWYTVMFVVACIISLTLIWILKGKLSEEEPGHGQQTLEVGVLAVRSMIEDIIGPHGLQYFPVVMTFAVLILVSNLMGLFPLFMAPTSATSVTFALGLSSFVYYNYIGISENGLLNHLKHFAGPIWWIAPLIFVIELVSNLVRPFSLGIRLFGNMFADEKVLETVSNMAPPYTYFAVPVIMVLMALSVFVALIQTFVFILLSQLYLSEVSHPPHDSHVEDDGMDFIAPVLT